MGSTGVCAGTAAEDEDDDAAAAAGEVGRSCMGEPCGEDCAWRLVSGDVVASSNRVRFAIVGVVGTGNVDGDEGFRIVGTGAVACCGE